MVSDPIADAARSAPLLRSLLFVPAHNARFVAKAHERGADAIIMDLEDSVPPAEKAAARGRLREGAASVGRNGATVLVRINADSAHARADAEAACRAGAFGLLVPKTRSAQELRALGLLLASVESEDGRPPVVLLPAIEHPAAVLNAQTIAAATPRVFGLLVGGEDLAAELGAEPVAEVLRWPKLAVHFAAKAAGLRSFGLLRSIADYADLGAIEQSAKEARRFGFDGATCVHPSAIAVLNRAFAPTAEELDRARRLVAAYEAALAQGHAACVFEGRMIDLPAVQRARADLARADWARAGSART